MGRAASEDAVKRAKAKAPRKKRAVAPDKPKDGFHLGARLKHARLLHQMRLKDVAARAGCACSTWILTAGTPGMAATIFSTSAAICATTSGLADGAFSITVTVA